MIRRQRPEPERTPTLKDQSGGIYRGRLKRISETFRRKIQGK